MGTEKTKRKITDAAAKVIFWHDDAQDKVILWFIWLWHQVIKGSAAVVDFHDITQLRLDRILLIVQYHFAKFIHERRKSFAGKKKSIMGHFAGTILVAIAVIALFNHALGFQYAYNGKVLGYVKNQEDVIKILDLVSGELSKEYGSNIQIDAETDISFKHMVVLDKEIDDVNDVLKRLTYLSDMQAEAYGIYINGSIITICESREAAESTLKAVQQEYVERDDKVVYEKVGFREDVEIKKLDTKLVNISSIKKATDDILTGGSKEISYEIKMGDTISGICSKYDISYEELEAVNPELNINSIFPGDKVIINKATSALSVVTVEKGEYSEKVKYKTEVRKSDDMYVGSTRVIQKGSNGKRVVEARITRENGEIIKKDVLSSKIITKPVKKIVVKGTKPIPKTMPTGKLRTPVYGYSLTSPFGWRWGRMHEGIDMACGTGTPIYAADGGTVVYSGWYSGYGMYIKIDHGGGRTTTYGHCSALYVKVGEKVYKGQHIAAVGNTGNSYGSHLHFEVRENGTPQNPFNYI